MFWYWLVVVVETLLGAAFLRRLFQDSLVNKFVWLIGFVSAVVLAVFFLCLATGKIS